MSRSGEKRDDYDDDVEAKGELNSEEFLEYG